jgi:hypothetical protein
MTVEDFAKQLVIELNEAAQRVAQQVQSGKSDGFKALIDAAACSALRETSIAVLNASIEKIHGFNKR